MNPIKKYFFYKRYRERRSKLKYKKLFDTIKVSTFVSKTDYDSAIINIKSLRSVVSELEYLIYYRYLESKVIHFDPVNQKEHELFINYIKNKPELDRIEMGVVSKMKFKHGIL